MAAPDWDEEPTISNPGPPDKDGAANVGVDQASTLGASSFIPVRSFAPNDTVAGRFRIVRFLARGGMGEVYEADDLELHERVALKSVRLEMSESDVSMERFRREIQLSRKVTHPNVCRAFDVFRHTSTGRDGSTRETLVVSMELLFGETLDQRIRRAGPLSSDEALPIVTQMAAGLQAAHQAGIVHRDFKSSNVFLVPAKTYPGGLRVAITDFGLAHSEATLAGQSLTATHDVVGTPAFMAPEQLEGGEVSSATDVYALGVVMFQMVTGELPFVGDTALAGALKRLNQPAPSPRSITRNLSANWESAILRCLERNAADRFASAQQVVDALSTGVLPLAPRFSSTWRRRKNLILVAAAVIALAAVAAVFGLRYRFQVTTKSRPSVAVLGFANVSGKPEFDHLGAQLVEQLRPQLETDQIRLVNPSDVDQMMSSLHWAEVPEYPRADQLKQIASFLGCDVIILGSYDVSGTGPDAEIAWTIRLEKTVDGQDIGTVSDSMTVADRLNRTSTVGRQVRDRLGVKVSVSEASLIDADGPSNGDALSLVAEGRDELAKFDVQGASKSFQQAVRLDDNYAEAHSALADTLFTLGYDADARKEAKRAKDLSAGLTNEVRALIDARYDEITHDWDSASKRYSSLLTVSGGDPDYALLLARSQTNASQPQQALQTIADLRKSSLPAGIAAQADLAEGEAQQNMANFDKQLAAAQRATQEAKSLGASLLLARASIQQCLAEIGLGQTQQADATCQQAQKLNEDTGDKLGTARAVNAIANAMYEKGNFTGALPLYRQALQTAQSIGDKRDEAGALNNIANIDSSQGNLDEAEKIFQQSIQVAGERDDKNDLALAQQNLAGVLYNQGDTSGALKMYAAATQLAHTIGANDTEARVLNNLCMLETDAGQLPQALKDCQSSLDIRNRIGEKGGIARSLQNIGTVHQYQGDFAQARQDYQQALSLQQSIGAKDDAAYSQLLLAEVAELDGKHADAKSGAESAATEFAAEQDKDSEAEARATLAQALLGLGQVDNARAQVAQAEKLVSDRSVRLEVDIASGNVAAAAGNSAAAIQSLTKTAKDAAAAQSLPLQFEAQLALGQAQIKAGRAAEGDATLRTLAKQAQSKGFAHMAQAASSGH